jgi:hypothetical protein
MVVLIVLLTVLAGAPAVDDIGSGGPQCPAPTVAAAH